MTIHGAKGLEFRAVLGPGLNQDTLPGNRQAAPACPPPNKMIEGASGTYEEFRETSRLEEKECLLYVALSRAKDRLVLYAAAANKSGNARKESEYLGRLGEGLVRRPITPERQLPQRIFSGQPIDGRLRTGHDPDRHLYQCQFLYRGPRRRL